MSIYIGNVERWKDFFNQFGHFSSPLDDLNYPEMNKNISVSKDLNDFFDAKIYYSFNEINRYPNFGKLGKVLEFFSYKDNYTYAVTMEIILDNMDDDVDLLESYMVRMYRNFYQYSNTASVLLVDNSIRRNLAEVHPEYSELLKNSFELHNKEAWHETIFIPYGDYCEVWLMESSAELYRFRCFAELIITHIIASYLNYSRLENITIDDLRKYNADLILNLDLLQQSDLPME